MPQRDSYKLDRRITIRRATITKDEFNASVETWSDLVTVWAHRRDASASERYRAQEVGAELTVRFTIRQSDDVAQVDPRDRILFDGYEYNITAVREPEGTRGRWLEIDAVKRADSVSGSP